MKVILAIDGSDCSYLALEEALRMLKADRDSINLVTVIDQEVVVQEDLAPPENNLPEIQSKCEDILNKYSLKCKEKGFEHVKKVILYGDIREEIIKYIEGGHYEMVIVGSRGLSVFKRIMLGSVSEYLVHHSPVPVYVVKNNAHHQQQIHNQHSPSFNRSSIPSM